MSIAVLRAGRMLSRRMPAMGPLARAWAFPGLTTNIIRPFSAASAPPGDGSSPKAPPQGGTPKARAPLENKSPHWKTPGDAGGKPQRPRSAPSKTWDAPQGAGWGKPQDGESSDETPSSDSDDDIARMGKLSANAKTASESLLQIYGEEIMAIRSKFEKTQKERTYEVKIDKDGRAHGSGGRKRASARVWIKPGDGTMVVNRLLHTEYFATWKYRAQMMLPFEITNTLGKFDVWCTARGGGTTGQAEAIRLAVAKALVAYNPEFRPALKKVKLLVRDSRKVERKKVGRKKARKSHTWVKR